MIEMMSEALCVSNMPTNGNFPCQETLQYV
jgi:hypothetical protein